MALIAFADDSGFSTHRPGGAGDGAGPAQGGPAAAASCASARRRCRAAAWTAWPPSAQALRQEAKRPAQALGLEVVHPMVDQLAGDPRLPARRARHRATASRRCCVRSTRASSATRGASASACWSRSRSAARPDPRRKAEASPPWKAAEAHAAGCWMPVVPPRGLRDRPVGAAGGLGGCQPRGRRNRERAVRAAHARRAAQTCWPDASDQQILDRPDAPPRRHAGAGLPHRALGPGDGGASASWTPAARRIPPTAGGWCRRSSAGRCSRPWPRVAGQHRSLVARIDEGLAIDHLRGDLDRWQNLLSAPARPGVVHGDRQRAAGARTRGAAGDGQHLARPSRCTDRASCRTRLLRWARSAPDCALPPQELEVGACVDLLAEAESAGGSLGRPRPAVACSATPAHCASMTRRKLDAMMTEGSLRLVSAHPVVDGALDAVARAAWRNSSSAVGSVARPATRRSPASHASAIPSSPPSHRRPIRHQGCTRRIRDRAAAARRTAARVVGLDAGLVAVASRRSGSARHAHVDEEGHAQAVVGLRRPSARCSTPRPPVPRTRP